MDCLGDVEVQHQP